MGYGAEHVFMIQRLSCTNTLLYNTELLYTFILVCDLPEGRCVLSMFNCCRGTCMHFQIILFFQMYSLIFIKSNVCERTK